MSVGEKGEYHFTWRIENYSSYYHKKNQFITSPVFKIENFYSSEWLLKIYPEGDEDEKYVRLDLKINEWNKDATSEVTLDFCCDILDDKGTAITDDTFSECTYSKTSHSFIVNMFIKVEELLKIMKTWNEDVLTVRCCIRADVQNEIIHSGWSACTILGVVGCNVEWDVKMPILYKYFDKVAFSISGACQFEITLTSVLENIEIFITKREKGPTKLGQRITFKFTLFDKIGRKLCSKLDVHTFESGENWIFPDFFSKELLEICNLDSSHYEFKLKCQTYFSDESHSSACFEYYKFDSSLSVDFLPSRNPVSALQCDFRQLFIEKKYVDVTIRTNEKEISAHKMILKMRSPVFAAMFDQNMLESQTGVVDVADMDENTVEKFIKFLYLETVDSLDNESAIKLIQAADKYQVPSLIEECSLFLKNNMSLENVCDTIATADIVNCESLKDYALNFIKFNAAKILPTPNWTQWIKGNVELASDILSKLSCDLGKQCD